ncbi:uncharacterized protein LOC106392685 [Brassica napus]|uniref:uncharacterized protein LOC106392685 n=1 Tax=Brassica napus TaxID=3708 RepID=UPI0006AAA4D7|nr:uncharacterized protein LOC106392685 [Brassica napus]
MVSEIKKEEVATEYKLLLEAKTKRMNKMMDTKLDAFRQEYQPQYSDQRRGQRRDMHNPNQQEHAGSQETDDYYEHVSSGFRQSQRRQRRAHEGRRDELAGVKLKIFPFHGKADQDAYLEWEKKTELVFDCQQYSQARKIRVAATEFYDYALSWWDQLVTSRRRNGEDHVDTWTEMKTIMRKRFFPSHYHRDLHNRLRKLTQGSRTVEEYYQELEMLMLRACVSEDREATMSRFLGGLNREIQDNLEMQQYVEIEEMLHKAMLVEQQFKRKGPSRSSYGTSKYPSSKYEKPNYQKESTPYQKEEAKPSIVYSKDKRKAEATSSRARDVKCFKCQGRGHYANECTNKRIMILLENGEYESEDGENKEEEKTHSGEDYEEEPVRGRLLVDRRTLNLQTKTEELEQRENQFDTRCLVQGKVCSLIVDGGSCVNVACETMVTKLGLKIQKHPKPYRLQWLNEEGEMRVSTQVMVPLAIGRHEDEVLCDVLPMEAGHILLGRPWQSESRVIHDGYTNKHSFEFKGRKTVFIPMTPKEVQQDQIQLQKKKKIDLPPDKNKQQNFYVKAGDIKRTLYSKQPVLLLVFKEYLLTLTDLTPVYPSELVALLQEYEDVFPEESPIGLPPIRGIEHQIDFVPVSTLPN